MSLLILDAGLETRLVDLGRPGSRRWGVPVGGAADRVSLGLANALVGNPPNSLGLEIAVKGPRLRAETDVECALVGAPFAIERNGEAILPQSSFFLEAGQQLTCGGCPRGMRAYLCVTGGFDGVAVLGSRSSLAPLRAGALLAFPPSPPTPPSQSNGGERRRHTTRRISGDCPFLAFPGEWQIRVTPGPQADWFGIDALTSQVFVVNRSSNRMGLRLDGVPCPTSREMVSEPVCPGSVQITREGLPIILGVDGQTIGGYPKIAVVCDADLDALGQMRPGDRVRFVSIDFPAAKAAWDDRRRALDEWLARIRISLDGGSGVG